MQGVFFLSGLLAYSPVRGVFSERTILVSATTRSARAISFHRGCFQNKFEFCTIDTAVENLRLRRMIFLAEGSTVPAHSACGIRSPSPIFSRHSDGEKMGKGYCGSRPRNSHTLRLSLRKRRVGSVGRFRVGFEKLLSVDSSFRAKNIPKRYTAHVRREIPTPLCYYERKNRLKTRNGYFEEASHRMGRSL